jgi:hypothetical protein
VEVRRATAFKQMTWADGDVMSLIEGVAQRSRWLAVTVLGLDDRRTNDAAQNRGSAIERVGRIPISALAVLATIEDSTRRDVDRTFARRVMAALLRLGLVRVDDTAALRFIERLPAPDPRGMRRQPSSPAPTSDRWLGPQAPQCSRRVA